MPFNIVRNDITLMRTDAIVNAANRALEQGGGVCGAIFKAAGERELAAACAALAPIDTGAAVITPGFALPARYIVHAVGPVYRGGGEGEEELLRSCYLNSLELAARHGCGSIAFPLISSGIYGYPKAEALRVAGEAIREFLAGRDMDVYLVVFDTDSFIIGGQLLGEVAGYIDEHYAAAHAEGYRQADLARMLREQPANKAVTGELVHLPQAELADEEAEETAVQQAPAPAPAKRAEVAEAAEVTELSVAPALGDVLRGLDEPFSDTLLRLIDDSGMTDVEVYKRANLDRRLFSKIRGGRGYMPSKRTVLALAIALELDLPGAQRLLAQAGYALSHSQKLDVIVEYFLLSGICDIFAINEVLFYYDQPLLGG